MAKEQFPHKIIWLASYPKSGNTWFRAFLTALLNDGMVEINDMKTDGIFSSREIFELISDIDSHDLYDEEVKLLLPDIYRQLAAERSRASIIKVHDAFVYNVEGKSVIPEDVTQCAVYFLRNPLDIAGSLANHNNSTIDQAITLMNNKQGCLAEQKSNLNNNMQLRQLMYDWSGHVQSWTTKPVFPVYLVKYEDMVQNTFETFRNIIRNIGWTYNDRQISQALAASSFESLSKQEQKTGFRERLKTGNFFRKGNVGNWENELNSEQIDTLIKCHSAIMSKYDYMPLGYCN